MESVESKEHKSFNDIFKQKIEDKSFTPVENALYGSVIGAFAGDAAGSYVEFQSRVTQQEAEEAVKMVGKGPFQLGRGQITDDSELAMCILQGLTDQELMVKQEKESVDKTTILNLDGIAYYFGKWLKGDIRPFDIGTTTRTAFLAIDYCDDKQKFLKEDVFTNVIMQTLQTSTSNGCIMRKTPLAAFCHRLDKQSMKKAVFLETMLTHFHLIPLKACYLYCYAISILAKYQDPFRAYEEARKEAASIDEDYKDKSSRILKWFEAIEAENLPKATDHMGRTHIAFSYSFHHLLRYIKADDKQRENFYQETMKQTIQLGGDTDTNAAIVGGLIGACVGINGIPKSMIYPVVDFDPKEMQKGRNRPNFIIPKHSLIEKLGYIIENAPEKLIVQANNNILTEDDIEVLLGRQFR